MSTTKTSTQATETNDAHSQPESDTHHLIEEAKTTHSTDQPLPPEVSTDNPTSARTSQPDDSASSVEQSTNSKDESNKQPDVDVGSDSTPEKKPEQQESASEPEVPLGTDGVISGDLLEKFASRSNVVLEETTIKISEHGLSIENVDPTNVQMARVNLSEEGFKSFGLNAVNIAADLNKLKERASIINSGDTVGIEAQDTNSTLHLTDGTLEANVGLISPDLIEDNDIPDFDFESVFTVSNEKLQRLAKAEKILESSEEVLQITSDPNENSIELKAEGEEDEATETITAEEATIKSLAESEGLYSMEIIRAIVNELPSDVDITVSYGGNYPISIKAVEEDSHLTTEYIVAPRVPSDSENA